MRLSIRVGGVRKTSHWSLKMKSVQHKSQPFLLVDPSSKNGCDLCCTLFIFKLQWLVFRTPPTLMESRIYQVGDVLTQERIAVFEVDHKAGNEENCDPNIRQHKKRLVYCHSQHGAKNTESQADS